MTRAERVIVVGLDGLEPSIVESMLDDGELPHLASLRDRGGYGRVATTNPAQTPVAWSTFATGVNPGAHGIFDFVGRDPKSYRPDLALNRYEQAGPFAIPRVVNRRRADPVWRILSDRGVRSAVIRCPCTYPPDEIDGRVLSGIGVPDLRGGFGTGTFYTRDEAATPGEAEQIVRLPRDGEGPIATYVVGPRHPRTRAEIRAPITLTPRAEQGLLILKSTGRPGELVLRRGEWSPWLRLTFKLGLLQSVRGMVRFLPTRIEPDRLELYASPVQFDPESPPFPISHPTDYAAELGDAIGPYYTTGIPEDHAALSNGRIDEAAFLSQCDAIWSEREAMFEHELGRLDYGLLYCLFGVPDRVQHLFWRHREPDHPANRDSIPPAEFDGAIADAYRRSDAAVGRAIGAADDRTMVIALSDHGFASFRRGVNVNTWLRERGFLTLDPGAGPGDPPDPSMRHIDWARTRAYALGLGGIYLNLKGREGEGVVDPGDAEALKAEIAAALGGLVDPSSGAVAVRSVASSGAVYTGPFVDEAPDLLVSCARGYRASWGSAIGGVGASVFEDNARAWSGDHIIDPTLVPGVLFMNRPFHNESPTLLDLAPTILEAFGQGPGPGMEGRSLLR